MYTCDVCQKKYKFKYGVTHHKSIAHGLKFYRCGVKEDDVCDFETNRLDSLKRHLLNLHGVNKVTLKPLFPDGRRDEVLNFFAGFNPKVVLKPIQEEEDEEDIIFLEEIKGQDKREAKLLMSIREKVPGDQLVVQELADAVGLSKKEVLSFLRRVNLLVKVVEPDKIRHCIVVDHEAIDDLLNNYEDLATEESSSSSSSSAVSSPVTCDGEPSEAEKMPGTDDVPQKSDTKNETEAKGPVRSRMGNSSSPGKKAENVTNYQKPVKDRLVYRKRDSTGSEEDCDNAEYVPSRSEFRSEEEYVPSSSADLKTNVVNVPFTKTAKSRIVTQEDKNANDSQGYKPPQQLEDEKVGRNSIQVKNDSDTSDDDNHQVDSRAHGDSNRPVADNDGEMEWEENTNVEDGDSSESDSLEEEENKEFDIDCAEETLVIDRVYYVSLLSKAIEKMNDLISLWEDKLEKVRKKDSEEIAGKVWGEIGKAKFIRWKIKKQEEKMKQLDTFDVDVAERKWQNLSAQVIKVIDGFEELVQVC